MGHGPWVCNILQSAFFILLVTCFETICFSILTGALCCHQRSQRDLSSEQTGYTVVALALITTIMYITITPQVFIIKFLSEIVS